MLFVGRHLLRTLGLISRTPLVSVPSGAGPRRPPEGLRASGWIRASRSSLLTESRASGCRQRSGGFVGCPKTAFILVGSWVAETAPRPRRR